MIDKHEAAILRKLGPRIREARQLCGFTIHKSAQLLGVEAEFLKRLEARAIDIDSVPLKFVKDASQLLDVSSDFLLGLAGDEWERDPSVCFRRQIGVGLHRAANKHLAEIAIKCERQERQIEAIGSTTAKMLKTVENLNEAVERFRELNPDFNNLLGSATLANRAKIASEAVKEARCQLIRCKILPFES